MTTQNRYRFVLIQAFNLPDNARYALRRMQGSKEAMMMNYEDIAPVLADIDWELHPGARAAHGDWPVETREEFALVGAARLRVVREVCEAGKHNAIVLLGGGDPGYVESREIGRRFGIAVTSCASAQMHLATMLGHRFSIIDIAESHNARMQDLVVQYRFVEHCASIRCIDFPLPRPPFDDARPIHAEKERAQKGERSEMLETAVTESIAAIEEDGAEVLMLGCSATYWMQPYLQRRLRELGWEIPVLEGYASAILQAKLMVDAGFTASGIAFPFDHPKNWRRRKTF
ncbi:MAG TPA: aspartate/glutamate racemase family protein [Casimicrobiaceae bacterium]|nr:aspartate/glutamate racemase family protein [Casimicrobiaceae bacterium]